VIRRLSVWLLLSVAIHAAAIGLTLALIAVTPTPLLLVDLAHGVLAPVEPAPGADPGRGGGTPARADPAASPPRPVLPKPSKAAPATAASAVRTVPAPAGTIASMPVPEPELVTTPEPTKPLPAAVPPPPEPPRVMPEPIRPLPAAVPAPPEFLRATPEPAPVIPAPPGPLMKLSPPPAAAPARAGEHGLPESLAGGAGVDAHASGGETAPPRGGEPAATPAMASRGDGTSPGAGTPPIGPAAGRGDGPASGSRRAAGDDAGLELGAGEGSALALAVPAERGGDGSEYAGYYAVLRRRVQEALAYPATARRRALTGTVQVELDIQPTGAITQVVLAVSSSHRVLDEAALEAVRGIERLPFPPDLRPRRLRVRLPVVFALD